MRAKNFTLLLFLCLFILSCGGKPPETKLPGTPLPWKEVSNEVQRRAEIKRDRLNVIIIPTVEQSGATQMDLLSTAMQAAIQYQQKTKLNVVTVVLYTKDGSQDKSNPQLALVTYIPDGKGVSGKDKSPVWERLMARQRGYSAQELEYLRLWQDMNEEYTIGYEIDEEALNNAICSQMGLEVGSLRPWENMWETIELSATQ